MFFPLFMLLACVTVGTCSGDLDLQAAAQGLLLICCISATLSYAMMCNIRCLAV